MRRDDLAGRTGRPDWLPATIVGLVVLGAVAATALPWLGNPALAQDRPADRSQDRPQPDYSPDPADPYPMPPELVGVDLNKQSDADVQRKSASCVVCHKNSGNPHGKDTVRQGCTDCHGGNAQAPDIEHAHVMPRNPDGWRTSANPARAYTLMNHESPEFVRFVNPGDFRIAHISCGTTNCHASIVDTNRKQLMTHGCMLWGAALYNNGSVPYKHPRHGEAYSMQGTPLRLVTNPPPTKEEMEKKGVLPFLDPLPRFEVSQPGNVLRIFERGGRFKIETGVPERTEEPGRPRTRLSERGLGTQNRTDPVLVSLNKTRLFDPTLNFLGTNDHPGDYRSSGCTACHVIYANDRSPVHSGPFHIYGNRGTTSNPDPTMPKGESGHPIAHKFVNGVPTSQCMVCHTHPGTTVMNSYIGYMWWDEETEGELMYPKQQKNPTAEETTRGAMLNPDEASLRGNWGDPDFLHDIIKLNPQMSKQQFGDFHSHGWVYRAVFQKDKKGNLLDYGTAPVADVTPKKLGDAVAFPLKAKEFHKKEYETALLAAEAEAKLNYSRAGMPVHMLDIHMEKGMHCVDCHFVQDMHGNGKLQMEVRAGTEIACIDCHGTAAAYTTLKTSGPASYTSAPDGKGRNLAALRNPSGKPRFEWRGGRLFQNSMVEKDLSWECVQTKDTITPGHPRYNDKSHIAKTVRYEGDKMVWGDLPKAKPGAKGSGCPHDLDNMTCITCHSSWNPTCYGCHLPQRANAKMPMLHWDGDVTRNYTPYNFQTLRDDVYSIARDGDVTGNRINPARSSCAIHVGSYNGNRESIYVQQQTISGEGLSGIAFSTNVPHTVRGKNATKNCTDCHVSDKNDNNAWMAQLMLQGTGYLNFIGKYCWVAAGEHGLFAVNVTETPEPQAVYGSTLHAQAFPDNYAKHVARGGFLENAHEHPGLDIGERLRNPFKEADILSVGVRGEYAVCACGADGVRAFDIAFIDDKAFAERITTAPVSPKGQKFYVPTKYATSVIAPTTLAPDPTRHHFPENKEPKVHALYGYVYVTDKYEGLITIGVGTALNGNPLDNFLKREVTFNPDNKLCGAKSSALVGTNLYICCDKGIAIVSLEDPTKPKLKKILGEEDHIDKPEMLTAQFRYGYVLDEEGLKVLDMTDADEPHVVSEMKIKGLHSLYLARTYAYVAAGSRGLLILDITRPDKPKLDQVFNAGGCINDLHDVKLGITYTTEFAYLADGKNGLRVVQLTGPDTPGNDGFSPRPTPRLVATYKLPKGGHALSISRGLDRDRAVDEAGNQIAVFGRIGARPLNAEEQQRMYKRDGKLWDVSNDPWDKVRFRYREPKDAKKE